MNPYKINKISGITIAFLLFFSTAILNARGTAGTGARNETRYIVDMPTAGVLEKNSFNVRSIFFSDGGVSLYTLFAPFKRFNIGLSYSGSGIIGSKEPSFQKYPGIQLSYRIVDEKLNFPAVTLGANTQGTGKFFSDPGRYETMSPGIYTAVSKNFTWAAGWVALHGGFGYTFEQKKGNNAPDAWIGIEQSLGTRAAINIEYNPNFNETDEAFFANRSLLNASLRVALTPSTTVALQVRDILENSRIRNDIQRYFCIDYIGSF